MEPEQWLKNFGTAAGIDPPADEEVTRLLELAAVAAHSSARTAAPIACWMAGKSGLSAAELMEAAERAGEQ
ncbi:MAG: molybdopterin-guanine dinucleotide biosynthesis protein [Solirubrobacterales bacterium]|jgi:hypothetical protein|nr:molybdopterin-guanine dinucleotide biosynthesis protein [Solirubrobacterales bacterium]